MWKVGFVTKIENTSTLKFDYTYLNVEIETEVNIIPSLIKLMVDDYHFVVKVPDDIQHAYGDEQLRNIKFGWSTKDEFWKKVQHVPQTEGRQVDLILLVC